MKTAWLLNHYAQEPSGSGGTRHYALARHALACGVNIVLIAASVEHFTGRQRLAKGENTRVEVHDGVTFLWIRTSAYAGNGAGRLRNMLEYSFRVLLRSSTRALPRPDLVIGSSVHPFAALAAERLAVRHKVPFVFEVRDLWPETLIEMGRLRRNGVAARVMRSMERWLYLKAARIVVLLPRAHEYIAGLGIDAGKIVWISNGVDLESFPYREPLDRVPLTVLYLGSHGQANGLDRILDAVAGLAERGTADRLRFRFIGDGPAKPDLERYAAELGIAHLLSFEAPVPKSRVPEVLAQADAFIVNVRDLRLYRYGISLNKLFDYLAAGRPVVFAGSSANDPVAEAEAGISVPGDDAKAMTQALETIADMPFRERMAMGRRGREHVDRHYTYRQLASRLCDALSPLMARATAHHRD
jgi:glycosyltransferase involved in cell wall biosynthesis